MNKQARIIGENLTRLIESRGLTQKELCDALGFSPQTLNTWIKGGAVPRMGKIQVLADYFGVNKTDIIEEHNTNDAFAALSRTDIIKSAFNTSGLFNAQFTDDEIIDVIKYAEFLINKRGQND